MEEQLEKLFALLKRNFKHMRIIGILVIISSSLHIFNFCYDLKRDRDKRIAWYEVRSCFYKMEIDYNKLKRVYFATMENDALKRQKVAIEKEIEILKRR